MKGLVFYSILIFLIPVVTGAWMSLARRLAWRECNSWPDEFIRQMLVIFQGVTITRDGTAYYTNSKLRQKGSKHTATIPLYDFGFTKNYESIRKFIRHSDYSPVDPEYMQDRFKRMLEVINLGRWCVEPPLDMYVRPKDTDELIRKIQQYLDVFKVSGLSSHRKIVKTDAIRLQVVECICRNQNFTDYIFLYKKPS